MDSNSRRRSAAVRVAIGFAAATSRSALVVKRSGARSSAAVTSAGSGARTTSMPSSVSRSARRVRAAGSRVRARAMVTCGRSSSSATSGPTWPVSASTLLRPQRIRSYGSRVSAAASARAVASVSAPAKARSHRCSARSAPSARHSANASRACGGPIVIATTSPPCSSRNSTARNSARTSKALISLRTPSRRIVRVSGSNCNADTAGTCLMQTAINIGNCVTGDQ